jgi:hypothetical protein
MLRERNFAAQCEMERDNAQWVRTGNSFSEKERRYGAKRVGLCFSMRDGKRAIECSVRKNGKFILRKREKKECSE